MRGEKRFTKFIQTATATSTLLLAQPSFSAVNYLALTLEQLLTVSVHSVSKKNEPIADAPAAVYAVTSADILRSGVTNIPDALRLVPGVQVAQSDSNSWAISIRGFNSTLANKLLVLIDGRTVYNPVFGGALWEAHDLILEDIERIEVIRGPGGSLWGANAVNGVINIITKHTRDTQGNFISAVYGNEEKGTMSVRHGGKFSDDGSYRVYAKGFKRDSSSKPPVELNAAQQTYDEWDGFRSGFRVDWADKFTLQGDAYRVNAQQLRPDYSLIAPFAPIEEQTIIYEGADLLGRWTDHREDGSQLEIQSYIDWAKRDEPFNFIDKRFTFDLEAQYDFAPMDRQEIIAGAGLRFLSDDKPGNHNVAFTPQENDSSIYQVFFQDKITLVPESWFLTLGSKFEHNDFTGWEIQPNIRLQWQPDDKQTWWAAVSRAVRTPTPIETNLTSTLATAANVRVAFVPNEEFDSEKLDAFELGYRNQITPTISLDLTAFYNDYKRLSTVSVQDPVLVTNDIDPPHFLVPVKFTNNMKGTTDGAEIVINWSINKNLNVSANYSYLHMSLEAIDPTQEGAEQLYPQSQAGLKIFWNIHDTWTLGTTASYVDELPAGDVDAYVRLDLDLSKQISKSLRFNLVGQNLLDSEHREFGALDDINVAEIERSIFVKLTWQF